MKDFTTKYVSVPLLIMKFIMLAKDQTVGQGSAVRSDFGLHRKLYEYDVKALQGQCYMLLIFDKNNSYIYI